MMRAICCAIAMTVILVCGPASIAQADDFTWSKVDVEPANWANSGNWSGPSEYIR